jgi:glycerol uptake facilitator-like aquaporin
VRTSAASSCFTMRTVCRLFFGLAFLLLLGCGSMSQNSRPGVCTPASPAPGENSVRQGPYTRCLTSTQKTRWGVIAIVTGVGLVVGSLVVMSTAYD